MLIASGRLRNGAHDAFGLPTALFFTNVKDKIREPLPFSNSNIVISRNRNDATMTIVHGCQSMLELIHGACGLLEQVCTGVNA